MGNSISNHPGHDTLTSQNFFIFDRVLARKFNLVVFSRNWKITLVIDTMVGNKKKLSGTTCRTLGNNSRRGRDGVNAEILNTFFSNAVKNLKIPEY